MSLQISNCELFVSCGIADTLGFVEAPGIAELLSKKGKEGKPLTRPKRCAATKY